MTVISFTWSFRQYRGSKYRILSKSSHQTFDPKTLRGNPRRLNLPPPSSPDYRLFPVTHLRVRRLGEVGLFRRK